MPSLHEHDMWDRMITGCEYGRWSFIHQLLDHPWCEIFKSEHRAILHDDRAVESIRRVYGNDAAFIADQHIKLDNMNSMVNVFTKQGKKNRTDSYWKARDKAKKMKTAKRGAKTSQTSPKRRLRVRERKST